jgi:hypothetical protein
VAGWPDRTLDDLLAAHELDRGRERRLLTDGWSGATFTTIDRDGGERVVVKRTSLDLDWIARATDDARLREAWLADAAATAGDDLGTGLRLPYLGAAADGDGAAIVMPDLTARLIAWDRPGADSVVDEATLEVVLGALASLHASDWADRVADAPWTPVGPRLRLLTPRSAAGYAAAGNPVGERFLQGWTAFRFEAPRAAMQLVERLDDDVSPLLAALARLPERGLHGDLKLANVAVFDDDAVGLIDWQMAMRAPVAVELGWLLVSNSGSLPVPPAEVLERYRAAMAATPGGVAALGDWDAQVDLAWIVGLLLRGWRKGLDAEDGVELPSGMRATDDLAWWCRAAVEAAERRLSVG